MVAIKKNLLLAGVFLTLASCQCPVTQSFRPIIIKTNAEYDTLWNGDFSQLIVSNTLASMVGEKESLVVWVENWSAETTIKLYAVPAGRTLLSTLKTLRDRRIFTPLSVDSITIFQRDKKYNIQTDYSFNGAFTSSADPIVQPRSIIVVKPHRSILPKWFQ
jgi:hypothetical protein